MKKIAIVKSVFVAVLSVLTLSAVMPARGQNRTSQQVTLNLQHHAVVL